LFSVTVITQLTGGASTGGGEGNTNQGGGHGRGRIGWSGGHGRGEARQVHYALGSH
jgi:hypothetical protein